MKGPIGLILLGAMIAVALVASLWTPQSVQAIDVAARFQPSSWAHPLGTDQLGRDLLSMLAAGAGPSLGVAALAAVIGIVFGVPLGLTAVACPGWVDEAIARAADILFAFPALVLAILIVAILGPGAVNAGLAIGLFNIPVFVRVTRAAARGVWARDFILAARVTGAGRVRISVDHILPNIAAVLIVQAAVQMSLGLIAEAGLSFLGLGAQPPQPSWGRMMADAQTLIATAPRLVLLPGLAMAGTVLAINRAGEELRARWVKGAA
ncbi:ABC transporter permease [uncultured Sphingomonas sp.]|uniref:ABC transporter permease n=1 Tax=uncultured Sphingomonas sp. TaxID=158754 RepID=UPI0025D79717|nr:ABC transporter permease [uncultured Sphingomonas sp.]